MRHGTQKEIGKFRAFYLAFPFWAGCVFWAVTAWWFLFPPSRTAVEYCFSRGWYRWVLAWTIPLTQPFRFPLALVLFFIGLIGFLSLWLRKWILFRRAGFSCRKVFGWGIRYVFLLVPLLVVWFLAFWGAGDRRLPLEERLQLDTSSISSFEAGQLQDLLLAEVRRDLYAVQNPDAGRAVRSIASTMAELVAQWDGKPIELPSRVKPVPGGLLLANGTSGICAPFTLEALVDAGLPDTAFVYSAAHELGHTAGFCREDDASFVGYLSGLKSSDAFARYACALSAYMDLISRLTGENFKKAFGILPEPARQDLKRIHEAYRKYQISWFSSLSWRTYDRYLQIQGVQEGVQSYSRGITFLAYAWRKGMLK